MSDEVDHGNVLVAFSGDAATVYRLRPLLELDRQAKREVEGDAITGEPQAEVAVGAVIDADLDGCHEEVRQASRGPVKRVDSNVRDLIAAGENDVRRDAAPPLTPSKIEYRPNRQVVRRLLRWVEHKLGHRRREDDLITVVDVRTMEEHSRTYAWDAGILTLHFETPLARS